MKGKVLVLVFLLCLSGIEAQKKGLAALLYPQGTFKLVTGEEYTGSIRFKKYVENYLSRFDYVGENKEVMHLEASQVLWLKIDLTEALQALNFLEEIDQEEAREVNTHLFIYKTRLSPKKNVPVLMPLFAEGAISVFQDSKAATNERTSRKMDGLEWSYSSSEGSYFGPSYTYTTKEWQSAYYVEKEGGALMRVTKKNLDELWDQLFGDCERFTQAMEEQNLSVKLEDFLSLVELYNELCRPDGLKL